MNLLPFFINPILEVEEKKQEENKKQAQKFPLMNLMQKTTTKSENNKAEKFNNKINKYS